MIGIATSWPGLRPATICVVEAPTSPAITFVTTILPLVSTVTVEVAPRALSAALSTVTAPVTWAVTIVAVADIPASSWLEPCVSTSVTL